MTESLLRIGTVKKRTGLSRSQIYRMMANREFPKNVQLTKQCVGWRETEIDNWIHAKIRAAR